MTADNQAKRVETIRDALNLGIDRILGPQEYGDAVDEPADSEGQQPPADVKFLAAELAVLRDRLNYSDTAGMGEWARAERAEAELARARKVIEAARVAAATHHGPWRRDRKSVV